MKKILSVLMVVSTLFSLVSCGNNAKDTAKNQDNNPLLTAAWEGYDELSFKDFLEKAMNNVTPEIATITEFKVDAVEGWDKNETLDDVDVTLGNTKATYSLIMKGREEDTNESAEILFFVELDKDTNTFEIISCVVSGTELSNDETEDGMEMVRIMADEGPEGIFEMTVRSDIG